ncbi:FAD-dependent oxidoreductase [Corynebacterium mendelii]|uniref:Glycerol-3-phosphate dehydrogenase/oxidase n=1 Tax=Corynebacterium mendelii TaxID=2765362 RepID=A0A939ITT5_9CORY|nr:glycerol-3-phosphate dehydrogenase/oxidase [Corynebacterium mendelii]MBN9644194.1 glycerol-3-phosphate dehydrogenase/oxidase [Corynebacterium mendelii]
MSKSTPNPPRPRITDSPVINGSRRTRWLEEVSANDAAIDLIVIGAGVTGCGVALDAATRGLKVVLVDKNDIAFGTSRWSSKLVHGGLRYLAKGDVGIAMRSARERGILMERTAPHLTAKLAQVIPVTDGTGPVGTLLPRMGFFAGDMLRIAAGTTATTLPRSRFITADEVKRLFPGISREGLKCGIKNFDGTLTDDARLVTALARTAVQYGATVITKLGVSHATGRSVTATDTLTGDSYELTAKAVVNATGVWAAHIDSGISIRPSRGTHLVLDADRLGNPSCSLTVPHPGSVSRFCFTLPGGPGRIYLGLTDDDAPGPIPDVPPAGDGDIDFLLGIFNPYLARPLARSEVLGTFTGLRPLLGAEGGGTADLSRKHATIINGDGVISIVGGKLTEYRFMAEQAVDTVVRHTRGLSAVGRCVTATIPLIGSPGNDGAPTANQRRMAGLPSTMLQRFGLEAPNLVDSCPIANPLEPVAESVPYTRAEIAWAITHEGALSAEDIVDRRTRIGMVASDRERCLPAVDNILDELSDHLA